MSGCCQDCEHYVHFMVVPTTRGDLKGDRWRIGVEWTNPEEGEFDVSCGVLFRRRNSSLSRGQVVGVEEFGPYRQTQTGVGAPGNLSAESAKVTAIRMKQLSEAQFYVAVDVSPTKEYELELNIALETLSFQNTRYQLSAVKITHRAPVVALHHVTREILGVDYESINTEYDPSRLERYASRQELSRSMSTWFDFDWEEHRLKSVYSA